MKKTILSVFILLILTSLHSQVKYKINENTYQKINLSFTFANLKSIDVETGEGFFARLYIDGCGGSKNIGEPELPVSVNMLEIPIFGDYVLNVYGKEFVIYDANLLGINYPVYPAQPSVSKSYDGAVEFIQNREIYQTDAFYALPLAQFKETGVMRNVNLGELYVSPVQYNPVTQEIKVYKSIDVEIVFKKVELVKTQIIRDLHSSPLFHLSNIINPMQSGKAEFSNTPIKYLIVAHEMFRGKLDNFTVWKKRKGFLVEVVYTDEDSVGTTTAAIAAFIKSRYDNATPENPAPTFVLLVGDVQQIPTFNYGYPTDLYYFTWAGGNLPCCYYGRFSAQNVYQLTPQIDKTLQYEKFTIPNANYLNNAVLIAGYDNLYAPVYGNGQLNYIANNYVNSANGYANVYKHLHPCNNEAERIRAEIGAGVGLANYTAHCNASGWYNPSFNMSHISRMTNTDKYGLMIGNCCESSKFDVQECFGEALLRAEGKGAVGYIGGSDDTYWDEDYYWSIGFRNTITANPTYDPLFLGVYDRLFHTQGEIYNNWMTTFGAIITAGNAAVQISTTDMSMKKYYWEIYNLMGDPSVMTYLSKPARMSIEINNVIPFGESTFYAKVVPYAYCALTDSARELVSAGFADEEGNITLQFAPMEEHATYEFAAWAQNYIQYFQTVYSGYVGVVELTMSNEQLTIYPNPTTGEFKIQNLKFKIQGVEVFDVYGRKQNAECRMQNVVDISGLGAGIYFVKITTNAGIQTQKVIKK
ncbi:MAG: C25 family cysteine peptidase [Bacteroidetes bacterium]|nr:C25 family cysteine peptidase [Bacteroidota bacterium]MCL1968678.1 C25 family cysteine peptidase [Bacteroidota bacterium]